MAGAVAGIVGSIVSQVAGSLVSSLLGSFSSSMLGGALGNLFTGAIGNAIKSVVDQLPLPNFIKDLANGIIDSAVSSSQDSSVSSEAQAGVDKAFGDSASSFEKSFADLLMEGVQANFEEESKKETNSNSDGENWLVALAKTMADIQNEHLSKMLEASDTMADNVGEGEEEREAFIDAQAEFQARSKLFGMASEATANALKTIGDGLASIARKQ